MKKYLSAVTLLIVTGYAGTMEYSRELFTAEKPDAMRRSNPCCAGGCTAARMAPPGAALGLG